MASDEVMFRNDHPNLDMKNVRAHSITCTVSASTVTKRCIWSGKGRSAGCRRAMCRASLVRSHSLRHRCTISLWIPQDFHRRRLRAPRQYETERIQDSRHLVSLLHDVQGPRWRTRAGSKQSSFRTIRQGILSLQDCC